MTPDQKRIDKGLYWGRAWSLVEGCTPVSPGCDHCWAAKAAHMRQFNPNEKVARANSGLTTDEGEWNGAVRFREDRLNLPGHRYIPTVYSIWNDLFHPDVPEALLDAAFNVMVTCEHHHFLVLTKRAQRMRDFCVQYDDGIELPDNIWLGVTVESQEYVSRIEPLLQTPAAVRWVSVEPMLGPVDLSEYLLPSLRCDGCGASPLWTGAGETHEIYHNIEDPPEYCGVFCEQPAIDWVVCGGESGPGARPMDVAWARDLRNQCEDARVPFWMKQMGGHPNNTARFEDIPEDLRIREFPNETPT